MCHRSRRTEARLQRAPRRQRLLHAGGHRGPPDGVGRHGARVRQEPHRPERGASFRTEARLPSRSSTHRGRGAASTDVISIWKGRRMIREIRDRTGALVTVRLNQTLPIGTYTISLAEGSPLGRADFVDSPGVDGERVVFHTEVDQKFLGRGLAGLLVREVLADSIRTGVTVVPVCPLFAGHLRRHGAEFVADGGKFRAPTPTDMALVRRATTSRVSSPLRACREDHQ
ncbi:N-acetyltransferase [Micromonospora sp. C32]|uniref:GNAT family N-acetyltransferase n=2 Tax=Micromonospora TaxID=1873 RepID=UPI001B36BF8A|nr:GNAT family N-acetyltransferase [Micromonospora sp. C72]MBQ1040925.1 N-acetyltransferase [Micromonospora sp. C72]MBQ1055269.1 N-acetyltransferase [Micromonospora sp. C32]